MDLSEILIFVVLPLLGFGYWYLNKKFTYFEEQGIPHLKPEFIFGNAKEIGKTKHYIDVFSEVYNKAKHKDVVGGFYASISPQLIVTDLELVELIAGLRNGR